MKNIKITLLVLLTLNMSSTLGQQRVNISWKARPESIDIDMSKWEDLSVLFVYNRVKSKYQKVNGKLKHTRYVHQRLRLLNEEALNSFNKLEIPYTDEYEVTNLHARSIHQDGTVTEILADDIHESNKGEVKVKLIAFENLAIGDDVEYYYEWNFPNTGFTAIDFNPGLAVHQFYFELETSKDIYLDLKPYNGIEVYEDTTTTDGTQILYAEINDIQEPNQEEQFAFPQRYAPRVEYYTALSETVKQPLSWDQFHPYKSSLYTPMYLEDRQLKKIISAIPSAASPEKRIFEIENYIKNTYKEGSAEEEIPGDRSIREVIQSQYLFPNELPSLIAAVLQAEGIDFKIGFTTNRMLKDLDTQFVNEFNQELLFYYFPEYDKYMMPLDRATRYSYLPFQLSENWAILYDTDTNKSYTTHYIPAKDSRKNAHNHVVTVSILSELDSVQISTEEALNDDSKSAALSALASFEPSQVQESLKYIVNPDETQNVLEVGVENADWSGFYTEKPLILKSKVNSTDMLQSVAPGEVLLNIGSVIGRQAELPRTSNERQHDIDMTAPHSLIREITLEVPAGYKVVNLDDLRMNKSLSLEGKEQCFFRSDYVLNGNTVTINIDERYLTSHLPKESYEGFREVINAAAEFNKLELLITKI